MTDTNRHILIGIGIAVGVTGIAFLGKHLYDMRKITSAMNEAKGVGSALFIGDSNTAANFSYADQLRAKYPKMRIKKIAKNGAKTDWMLERMEDEMRTNKYDVVLILGGSNDIYALGRVDSAKNNLSKMYDLAHKNGSRVVAIAPPNKNWYANRTEHKQQLLNELVNWIMSNPKVDYKVNFWQITNDKKYFSPSDGYLHAQAPAHRILATEVANKLKLA